MRGRTVAIVVGALALAGCGGGGTETVTVTKTVTTTRTDTTPLPGETTVRVYFLRDGKVAASGRTIPRTRAVAAAALRDLFTGPTEDERALGLTSAVPEAEIPSLSLSDDVASLTPPFDARDALAQVVYTLTQFPTITAVQVAAKKYTRADFEELTPAILVESPLPFEHVTAPLRVTGTANTFEATFEYELEDPDGKIVKKGFTTATSGSGTRGTFDFTIPFEVAEPGLGQLVVFERSAADGSRTNVVEIPVRFGPG
jgi:germination protein M